jgi:hypothetical protein
MIERYWLSFYISWYRGELLLSILNSQVKVLRGRKNLTPIHFFLDKELELIYCLNNFISPNLAPLSLSHRLYPGKGATFYYGEAFRNQILWKSDERSAAG